MGTKQACFLVGGVLLGIGFLFGVLPVTAMGADCGSGFAAEEYNGGLCDDAVNGRETVAIALGLPGLVLLGVGYGIVHREQTLAAEADRDRGPDPASPGR